MLEIRRSGPSLDTLAAALRDVPERVMPYAAAIALTKAAQRAQKELRAEMQSVFNQPVAYTLNSTRIEVATAQKLFARVAVKDGANGGERPTSYLLPEVEGGRRSHTGVESALRRSGLLRSDEWALPQSGSLFNSAGNVSGPVVRGILRELGRKPSKYFVGEVGRKHTRGLWERTGGSGKGTKRSVKAVYVFTKNAPTYRPLLDFTGAAQRAVRNGFDSDFYAAAATLTRKFS